ncbi:MAG TPA: hypothetical protein VM937_05010 [Burkholderiaceae bacterium]|nr:hypothetical protein [Burkholderiaceae bacterium]
MLATLMVGLAADICTDIAGQTVIGAVVWFVLLCLLINADSAERFKLMACLVIATAGELFLSLAWGLYTYRLENIPLFVPPGHVLLLLLGLALARRMTEAAALTILGLAGAYSLSAAVAGTDTLGALLFALLATACLVMPKQRRLYASTFVLALALELWGTWLGNWSWERGVPATPLVTTNPPLAAGAFYCVLDALVLVSHRMVRWISDGPDSVAKWKDRWLADVAQHVVDATKRRKRA